MGKRARRAKRVPRGAEEVVNFGMATLKEGFLRFVNNYSDPALCASASLREDISFKN